MRRLTRYETLAVAGILAVVLLVTWSEMGVAIRRARDVQRREDIGVMTKALHLYREENGFVPPSINGTINGCIKNDNQSDIEELLGKTNYSNEELFDLLVLCPWGNSPLEVVTENSNQLYIENLPQDPKTTAGISYLYLSNTNRFQIYTYLEGENEEDGYNEGIAKKGLMCGNKICNFGKAYGNTPLDVSIEEYEEELARTSGQ